jgi:hypothetical protein
MVGTMEVLAASLCNALLVALAGALIGAFFRRLLLGAILGFSATILIEFAIFMALEADVIRINV